VKALSIRQPWAWAIMHAGKRIENRDWFTGWRGDLVIHASAGGTQAEISRDLDFVIDICPEAYDAWPGRQRVPLGALVGVARLDGVIRDPVDLAAYVAAHGGTAGRWYMGSYGLVLADVRRFVSPIPYKGTTGLFEVPESMVREAIASAEVA
jgi:hypothetical protein